MLDDGDVASEGRDMVSHISGAGLAELEDSSDFAVGLRRSRSTGGGDKTVVLSDNLMWGTERGDGREWDSRERCEDEDKEEEEGGGHALNGMVSSGRRWESGGLQKPRESEQRRYSVGKASSPSRLKPPSSAGSRAQPPARKGTPPPPPTPRRSCVASGAATAVPTAAATSVEEWLEGMGLGAYAPTLLEEGWDSMDLIATLTEADLRSLGVKGGHARKMMLYRPKA
jgi:hypothetical protein